MKLDTQELNIKFIEDSYPKEVRVDLIQSLLVLEKTVLVKDKTIQGIEASTKVENLHKMLDQIFSVILKNLNWNIASSSNDWDYRPINVMKKTFFNIEKTKWYDIRHQNVIDQLKTNTIQKEV